VSKQQPGIIVSPSRPRHRGSELDGPVGHQRSALFEVKLLRNREIVAQSAGAAGS